MAIKISDLKVGDILHDVHRERVGNTTMSAEGHWLVYVRRIDDDFSWVDLSWNGNKERRYYRVPPGYKRHPKEWIMHYDARSCGYCHAKEKDGHAPSCDHPRAIAARKRQLKSEKPPESK
jgi:hypothetical protein